jgi:hypothetical protein
MCSYLFLVIYTAIDWDNISKSRPPSKPARDINTATQSEIGNFDDDKNSKKIVLSDEDQKTYEKWDFISKRSFQEEVVDFYICEEKHVSTVTISPFLLLFPLTADRIYNS